MKCLACWNMCLNDLYTGIRALVETLAMSNAIQFFLEMVKRQRCIGHHWWGREKKEQHRCGEKMHKNNEVVEVLGGSISLFCLRIFQELETGSSWSVSIDWPLLALIWRDIPDIPWSVKRANEAGVGQPAALLLWPNVCNYRTPTTQTMH